MLPDASACPRCARSLTSESFAQSVALLRCADCGGCFVPRSSFGALLDLERPAGEAASRTTDASTFARLLRVIRRLFDA